MKHLIIGNSAAGVAAAQTIRLHDAKCSITIITDEDKPYYTRCLLADYIAGETTLDKMLVKNLDFYHQYKIDLLTGMKIEQVQPESKAVVLSSGKKVHYDRLLIATGASTFFPPVPGVNLEGVYGLRTLADAERILEACENAKEAVVIGGGLVGLEVAEAFIAKGMKATVVEKLPQILPLQLDYTAAQLVAEGLWGQGISLITGVGFTNINRTSWLGKMFGKPRLNVFLENGDILPADLVVMAAGARPNVQLVKDSGIQVNRGIVVNEFMETNIKGIYAAGDVAEAVDAVTGQPGLSPIWPNAQKQGKLAGLNMAGKKEEGESLIAMQNAMTVGNLDIISLGIVNPPLDSDRYQVLARHQGGSYKKLVLEGDLLVGVVLAGAVEQAGVYGALIKSKKPVKLPPAALMADSFNYSKMLTVLPAKIS